MKLLSTLLTSALLLFYGAQSAGAFEHRIQAGVGQYTIDYVEPLFRTSVKPVGAHVGWVGSLNEYLSFDARLAVTGQKTGALGLQFNAVAFSALVRPTLPLGDQAQVFGLLGVSSVAIGRTGPGNVTDIGAKAGVSYGAGADFAINEHFSVGGEWVSYIQDANVAAAGVAPIKISLTGISALFAYHF